MNTQIIWKPLFTTPALAAVTLVALVAAPSAHAAGVSAGTFIENTAVATYEDGDGPRTVNSNTVSLRVDELIDLTLVSLDPAALRAAPGDVVLTFELTHQGNGPEAFLLTANPAVGGNAFNTTVTGIALDTNGNGTYDPTVDVLLTAPETTPVLASDDVRTVFVLVNVPAGVADGAISNVELHAQAVTGFGAPGTQFAGAGVGGGDAIIGMTGAFATASGRLVAGVSSVTLSKSVAVRDPFGGAEVVPGSIATFTISATVSGSGDVTTLVVTDAIPAGTTYAPGTLALDGSPLSDGVDGDAGQASGTDGVRVDLGTVTAGSASRNITFDVVIN